MNKWGGHVSKNVATMDMSVHFSSLHTNTIVQSCSPPPYLYILYKRQVKKTLVKWWWYGSHLTPHTAAVQFLLLQFDIWLPKKGERRRRRRRSRRWDCGGCWGLKAVLRKLDFHAAVKRPAGVEIGYTALLPEAVERCEVIPYNSL